MEINCTVKLLAQTYAKKVDSCFSISNLFFVVVVVVVVLGLKTYLHFTFYRIFN